MHHTQCWNGRSIAQSRPNAFYIFPCPTFQSHRRYTSFSVFVHVLPFYPYSQSLSLSITRRKYRSSRFAASYNGFDGYISLIVRADLATIIARRQYLRKRKIDENIADLKRNLDFSLQGCGATYYVLRDISCRSSTLVEMKSAGRRGRTFPVVLATTRSNVWGFRFGLVFPQHSSQLRTNR